MVPLSCVMYSYTCSAMRKNCITENKKLCSPIVTLNVEWKALSVNLTTMPVLPTSRSPINSILNKRSYVSVLAMPSSKINKLDDHKMWPRGNRFRSGVQVGLPLQFGAGIKYAPEHCVIASGCGVYKCCCVR